METLRERRKKHQQRLLSRMNIVLRTTLKLTHRLFEAIAAALLVGSSDRVKYHVTCCQV